ncbi:SET and MYND domain-containing protein 4 isoform X2 [Odontomachus brunneus]|nr:SET and MYND domain-containing protein 4 isoform X2 [Odontomachus brunneus]XP_032670458.1 SET and MYND domain-containing protein 4 isoform X2 [Odontomachus brunneus]
MEDIVKELMFTLVATDKYYDVINNFQKLKTDQYRVIFTFNIIWENHIIPYSHVVNLSKNAEESERIREDGNSVFVTSTSNLNLRIALNIYTQSISLAPYPSRQLALAYANRSAVLYELALYSECIQDINRALDFNYPDDRKGKLYMRKTQCLIILKNVTAKNMIKKTEYWINKMTSGPNKLKLQTKLDELRQKTEQKSFQHDPMKQAELESESPLPVIKSYNNDIPCASDAVVLKYDENNGRHVIAARNIDAGEVVVVEKPYSLLLSQENTLSHCSNCLKNSLAPIPCKYCTYSLYCSEKCRDIEWSKCHYIECSFFSIMAKYGFNDSDFLSLRLAVLAVKEAGSIHALKTMLEEVDKSDDSRTKGFSQDGKFHSDKYISLYSLERNTEKRPFIDLFRRTIDTCFILYLLATCTKFFGIKFSDDLRALARNDDVTFVGGLILRHQQIIPTNVHCFTEQRYLECDPVQRGLAAMPFCSLFNHSCSPNMMRISRSQHIVLYAMYPIRKGEQLFDNYGYHFAVMSKIQRQQKLLQHYYFTCSCIPCQENWPLFTDLKSYKILVKTKDDKNKIKNALKKFNTYVNLAEKGDVLNKPYIIEDLLMMIRVLYDRVPIACKEMGEVVETLKRVNGLHGNKCVSVEISMYK